MDSVTLQLIDAPTGNVLVENLQEQ